MSQKSSEFFEKYVFFQKLITLSSIEHIWLFGSRARKDHQDRADIDIAIDCPSASEEDWLSILDIVEDADTLLSIDCVRFDSLDLESPLKQSIEREGVLLYEKRKNSSDVPKS